MKKPLSLLLCAGIVLSLLAGCGKSDDPYVPTGDGLTVDKDFVGSGSSGTTDSSQALRLTYYGEKTMNPYLCTDFTNRALFSLIYQSLFIVDREYNVEPMLCKQFSVSQDMKTYTFYMESATFSDGTVLTARDVTASLVAARENPVYKGRFTHVSAITTGEDNSVVITLRTPVEDLPLLLDIPIVKEGHVAIDRPLGTGPYVLDETGNEAVLRRRDNWWCAPPMEVTAKVIGLVKATNNTQIRDNFEFNGLSLVCADPCSDQYADYRCDYELWDSENNIFLYLACNMKSSVFSNDTVRSALPSLVDRDGIAEAFYRGFARSTCLPASPLSKIYNSTLAKRYAYDGGVAFAQAVKDAGMTGMPIVFLANSDDSLRLRVAKTIVQSLKDAGLTVTLSALNTSGYTRALQRGEYDVYLGQTKLSPNMDLSAFFSQKGALSYGNLSDVALSTMCSESLANYGNFYSLHQAVMNDGRLCPILMRSYAVYAIRGLLTGLTPARENLFYYSLGKTMSGAKLEK